MQQKIPSNQNFSVEIPEDIICSITGQIMTDPVMLVGSGHSYEREAILKWLKNHNTDPLTNIELDSKMVVPNLTIKKMISRFLEKHKGKLVEDTYLPESLIQNLVESLEKNDSKKFKDLLDKDNRLLSKDLKNNKDLLRLGCESASLEILTIILEKQGEKILKLPYSSKFSLFLMVGQRLGLEGARALYKSLQLEISDLQILLNHVVRIDNIAIARIALSMEASVHISLLNHAYAGKQTDMFKLLFLKDMSVQEKDKSGNDFLMRTICDNYDELSLFLMTEASHQINPNIYNAHKEPALHVAVEKKNFEVVKLLLNHPKINIQQTDGKAETALHAAVRNGDLKITELLLKNKLDVNAKTKQGESALDIAYKYKNFEVQKLLINAGSKINDLLFKAIENEEKELIRFLLTEAKDKVDINLSNSEGKSALMLAAEKNQIETLSLILNHPKIDLYERDSLGNRALHYAALFGHQECVKLLMKKGCSIKDINYSQMTVLQLAQMKGHHVLSTWMEGKHRAKKIKPFIKHLKLQIETQKIEMTIQQIEIKNQKNKLVEQEEIIKNQQIAIEILRKDQEFLMPNRKHMIIEQEKGMQRNQEEQQRRRNEEQYQAARERKRQEDSERAKELLKWVVEGHLLEAEKLLSKTPQLALEKGTVTDLSSREFKNITPLQYAFWSLDVEMMEVILKYSDKGEALKQITAFEKSPQNYSQHGVHYDVSALVKKTQEYIENYSNWNNDQRENHWQKQIGGAQRHCPAWMIYGMGQRGTDAAWPNNDSGGVGKKRDYQEKWPQKCFTDERHGGKLGFRFGLYRGKTESLKASRGDTDLCQLACWDWLFYDNCNTHRLKMVESLKTELTSQTSVKLGMKP